MEVFSVSQFLEYLNVSLTSAVFPEGVVIEGEVAEYRVSQDRWIWFQMKDASAIVSCFATVWQLRTPLEDGMKIRAYGIPKVHPKSGKFSVTVERVELVGEGALKRAFELLKKKLTDEGLFDVSRKRPLPRFPQRIGLIASAESAAYGDFLRILGNRWAGIDVHVANVAVQGRDAVREICGAFRWFNAHPDDVDVLVLTRGGGSMEDLQAFNSEEVARAVFGSAVPVIVAVGHERDESLADYAADVRASTPSNAAERIVPDRREVLSFIESGVRTMDATLHGEIKSKRDAVDLLAHRIETHARQRIGAFNHLLRDFQEKFADFENRVRVRQAQTDTYVERLMVGAKYWSAHLSHKLLEKEKMLRLLDPQRPLQKGYALVRGAGGVITDAAKVAPGEKLEIMVRKGKLGVEVLDAAE